MKIILNRIQTPDGTILTSRHRHDFVTHVDTITGEEYMLDGGHDYRRSWLNKIPPKDLSVYCDAPFEEIRAALEWGTYGINRDQPCKWVILKDMDTDHIQAILDNCNPMFRGFFEQELEYRKKD